MPGAGRAPSPHRAEFEEKAEDCGGSRAEPPRRESGRARFHLIGEGGTRLQRASPPGSPSERAARPAFEIARHGAVGTIPRLPREGRSGGTGWCGATAGHVPRFSRPLPHGFQRPHRPPPPRAPHRRTLGYETAGFRLSRCCRGTALRTAIPMPSWTRIQTDYRVLGWDLPAFRLAHGRRKNGASSIWK